MVTEDLMDSHTKNTELDFVVVRKLPEEKHGAVYVELKPLAASTKVARRKETGSSAGVGILPEGKYMRDRTYMARNKTKRIPADTVCQGDVMVVSKEELERYRTNSRKTTLTLRRYEGHIEVKQSTRLSDHAGVPVAITREPDTMRFGDAQLNRLLSLASDEVEHLVALITEHRAIANDTSSKPEREYLRAEASRLLNDRPAIGQFSEVEL